MFYSISLRKMTKVSNFSSRVQFAFRNGYIHICFILWLVISYGCWKCNCVLDTITILCLVNWHGYILKGSSVAISKKEFQKKDIIFFLFFWSSGQSNFPSGSRRRVFNQTHFLIIWYVAKYWPKILFEIIFWPAQFHNPFRSTLYII